VQRFLGAEYAHIPDDFPMDQVIHNVENHFVISTLFLLNRYFQVKKISDRVVPENASNSVDDADQGAPKTVFAHIPEEFPMNDFVKAIQRNPSVALVYVDWFYRLFSQLDRSEREAIEPSPGALAICETMMV